MEWVVKSECDGIGSEGKNVVEVMEEIVEVMKDEEEAVKVI